MIDTINQILKVSGSNFATEDGLTLIIYAGDLIFLTRIFGCVEECYDYVVKHINAQWFVILVEITSLIAANRNDQ